MFYLLYNLCYYSFCLTARCFRHAGASPGRDSNAHTRAGGAHELTEWKQQKEFTMAQKLFIGGLSFSTSTERLREVFAAAGQVESAAVVTDRETGRSRGFGFVEMATAEEADQAIAQFNGKDVDGRQLRVEKASASGPRNGGGGSSRGFGGASSRGRW
jgi:cold-inducible RNA-binding protein